MRLTEDFWLSEFTKSATASRLGLENKPQEIQLDNIILLCKHILQPLRNHYGKIIRINSGFRGYDLNKAIGGASMSQHMFGQAADIDTVNDNADLFFYIRRELPFDNLIWEFGDHTNPDWIHVSYSDGNNRGEVLRAERINGKTVYTKMS